MVVMKGNHFAMLFSNSSVEEEISYVAGGQERRPFGHGMQLQQEFNWWSGEVISHDNLGSIAGRGSQQDSGNQLVQWSGEETSW